MEIKVNVTVNGEVDVQKIAEQIRQQIELAQKPALKVGDYAKVVNYAAAMRIPGNMVKITETNRISTSFKFRAELLDGSNDEVFTEFQLVKATEEEVAEAKCKLAEAKRWAAIGRKPNEFKKGDAVKYKNAFTTVTESIPGLIRINQSNNVDKNIAVRPADLTLVFPVESRFE